MIKQSFLFQKKGMQFFEWNELFSWNCNLPILSIVLADVNFWFFVYGGSASSEMTTMSVPKVNWGQPSKRDRKAPKNIFSVSEWLYMIGKSAFFCQVALALHYCQDWLTLKISWPGSWISLRIIEQIFCLPTYFSCDPLSIGRPFLFLVPTTSPSPRPSTSSRLTRIGEGWLFKNLWKSWHCQNWLDSPSPPYIPT